MANSRTEELARIAAEAGEDGPGGDSGPFKEFTTEGPSIGRILQGPVKVTPPEDAIPTRVKVPTVKETPKEKPKPSRGTASERELAELTDQLTEQVGTVAGLIHGIAPVTSVYAAQNSGKALEALVSIAQRHPAMLKGLKKAADGVDAMEIAKFVIGLVMCIQVDTGRLNGDEFPARMFGVTEIMDEYFNDETVPPPNPNLTGLPVPNAYTFQPV